ncbi:hypothetical protein CC78DRAFT_553934 [Lojkania enalia]|uniref:Uncharacterized protein n=1 Tax=Lojkania enalia TaxID=147567 RepID=A0A9P4N2P0_9PLEO|nr:hypothetical protein CC78DRAFT_553934 [Didymosphaeria enalia]
MPQKRSLLIGINYTGAQHTLQGYHADIDSIAHFFPTADTQTITTPRHPIRDYNGNVSTGYDHTIVLISFKTRGRISSTLLHEHLVARMALGCSLFIFFFFGLLSLGLVDEAQDPLNSGFSFDKMRETRDLLAGGDEPLEEGGFAGHYGGERKVVTMLVGVGLTRRARMRRFRRRKSSSAMLWAFLETMKKISSPTYVQTLRMTMPFLDQGHYVRIPQLSYEIEMDLDQRPVIL